MAVNPSFLKVGLSLMALCLLCYIVGPPLYWHLVEGLATTDHSSSSASSSVSSITSRSRSVLSCPPCNCDCTSQSLPTIPSGLKNSSFADCAKHDPDVAGDTEKNFVELLSEELRMREAEAVETQRRIDSQLLEAKKMTSQYQKEADKCNAGMETCEEAREKAEAALLAQKKLSSMWEMRARQKGWKEGAAKPKTHAQGNAQTM